jgi:hypothetical protein
MALEKTNLVPAKLKVLGQIRAAKLVECPFESTLILPV